MSMRIVCPEGHPVALSPSKLGRLVLCPCCFSSFWATLNHSPSWQARKDEGKVRRPSDDDEDDDEDEVPQKKSKAKAKGASNKDDDDDVVDLGDDAIQADDKPSVKKSKAKKDDEVVDL